MSNTIQRPTLFRSDDPTRPLSGGLVYFYEAGTTTPLTIYSDRTFATPIANPVVLDAGGRAPTEVFVPDGVAYKIRIEDSLGVLQYESDNLVAASSSDQTITIDAARQLLGYIPTVDPATPAVGDGVADDTTALTNAINSSTATIIDLGGKTYKVTSAITITRSNIMIRNGTIDMGSSGAFVVNGAAGSWLTLTNDTNAGTRVVTVASTAGLASGDVVQIETTDPIFSVTVRRAELATIASVDSGTQITLNEAAHVDYLVADAAQIRKITTSTVRFEGVSFVGNPSRTDTALDLLFAKDCIVRDCSFTGVGGNGVRVDACLRTKIQNSRMQSTNVNASMVYTSAGAADTTISDCHSSQCISLLTEAALDRGFNLGTIVENCTHAGSGPIVRCEAASVGTIVRNVRVTNSGTYGLEFGGVSLSVDGFESVGSALDAIYVNNETVAGNHYDYDFALNYTFRDLRVKNPGSRCFYFRSGAIGSLNISISDAVFLGVVNPNSICSIEHVSGAGLGGSVVLERVAAQTASAPRMIEITASVLTAFRSVVVRDCNLIGSVTTNTSVYLAGGGGGVLATKVTVQGGYIGNGIHLVSAGPTSIEGCSVLSGAAGYAILRDVNTSRVYVANSDILNSGSYKSYRNDGTTASFIIHACKIDDIGGANEYDGNVATKVSAI